MPSESDSSTQFLPGFILTDWHPALRYGISVVSVAVALALDRVFAEVLLRNFSFVPLAAVIVTALCAGYGPALLAAAVSLLGLEFFFWIPADGGWSAVWIGFAYGLVALSITYITGTVRGLNRMLFRNAEELEKAVEERNELVSVLSQDFRTHLTTLRLNHGVLRMLMQSIEPKLDERLADRLKIADREMSRLSTLIDNVVYISKSGAGRQIANRAEIDLSELVKEIADSLNIQAEQANCRLSVDLHPAVGRWDRFRLERLLLNLLTYAIKYAPGRDISLRTSTADGRARLTVEDHGTGIPEEQLDNLFKLPAQNENPMNKEGEPDLELYVAKAIVDAHGGKISVESHAGNQWVLTVDLPLWQD